MHRLHFLILTILVFQLGFSQTGKVLQGKLSGNGFAIQGADIINYTAQKSAVTNSNGVFYISAKVNDILLIHHKNFIEQKIILSKKDINNEILDITLIPKTTELEEVVVDKGTPMRIKISQADIDGMKLLKNQATPKVEGINDGTIPNGVDFVRLGKDAAKLVKKAFKSDKKSSTAAPDIEFKKYVYANIRKDYYTKNLKINADEIPLFLNFCDSDPNSKILMQQPNVLSTMDFLMAKNIEFQKVLHLVK